MKRRNSISTTLLWSAMGIVILAVVTVGLLTNFTLRSVEKNLPGTLLSELQDQGLILEDIAATVAAADMASHIPTPENFRRLRHRVETVQLGVVALRDSYVFDNLVNASAFHSVIAPAIADLKIWLAEGVSGYGPESEVVAGIALSRISEAHADARALSNTSQLAARNLLREQRTLLERFLISVNLLFGITITLTLFMVFLLARQFSLQKKKGEAQSRRDLAEKSLNASEKRYRKILESIEDGYYEVDLKGSFTFFNESMQHMLGYSPAEMMGMNNRHYMDGTSLKKVFHTFNHVYRTGRATKTSDWELIRKDGRRCFIETSISLVRDAEGEPVGFRGLCRDVSDKRKLEAQLQRSQKMEALGLLAGGVAHDLNNVLSGIVSYPELLLMDLPENSPLRKPLLTVQQSGKRASEIVQDLLTLARRGVTQTELLNINSIVTEYLNSPENAKLLSYHRSVRIDTNLTRDLLNIRGSTIHLKKTVMNLVSNAAEAQPRGGQITITSENRYVDRPVKGYEDVKEGDYVVLKVADKGEGIAAEDLKHLFEPFYTKKVMGRSGTGLGMAVVWGTVQDHSGYIDIKSAPAEGTLFELYFPANRDSLRQADVAMPVDTYTGHGEMILVVDDIKAQRDIASSILERLGYTVAAVSGGEAAVDYLMDQSVDLVILDMIMDPGIDGLDTYKRILARHPHQKAIVASGFSETERVKEVQRLGAQDYIKKPYTVEKIGLAVKKVLGRSQC